MSVQATNTFHAKPNRADELIAALRQVLPDTLTHDGCEEIRLWRDQDDQDRVVSLTRWATRRDYEAYLEWRDGTGDTAMFREMLTEDMEVRFHDEVFTMDA
ncbi:antibiotic biosynthesis monooxygenase [Streptacidiphilus sp. PB12-B1b]|uniref:putative quinol monooxygenase n=1 Tax=Streptacidiphilus sp. PB12-B1b TaxID=2705012 RepID=UPI0015F916BE|nr:antibiotic biosynthesis monooxygenase family protein [Streptacidiphilus sp. PB12-B1b]QMU75117.1 antibiotic biosynthesis monooxygenase [Streptacidiphilus sp. PB12-B1b]